MRESYYSQGGVSARRFRHGADYGKRFRSGRFRIAKRETVRSFLDDREPGNGGGCSLLRPAVAVALVLEKAWIFAKT